MTTLIYVASPYNHPSPAVRLRRYKAAVAYTAKLVAKSYYAFSPIVHCHPLALAADLPLSIEFWWNYNLAFLNIAHIIHVLQLPGWDQSAGVAYEISYAKKHEIPIKYVNP